MLKSRPKPSSSPLDAQGSQPSNPTRSTMTAWRTARLLIVPAALVATVAFSCSDDDETVTGPNGGSGGQTSNGGSAGIGGSGGNGGSSVAGAAGNGGSSGAGGVGGSAGTAGTAGTAGAAGTAGVANDPDAGDGGTDPDSGTPQLTAQEQAADAMCVRLDDVASCPAPVEPCRQGVIDTWEAFKSPEGGCPDAAIVDAYFNCLATEPDANYDCSGDNTPEFSLGGQTGGCADEEGDLLACLP